jgi:outer membrane protein
MKLLQLFRRRRSKWLPALALLLAWLGMARAVEFAECPRGLTTAPVVLSDAVDRALCTSPKTRGAWANVKAAAAVVGESKAAYLPTLDATAEYEQEHVATQVRDAPELNSSFSDRVLTGTVSLQWLLFDFGNRSATLADSRQMLAVAQATQNETLQNVVAGVAKDYFSAQIALAKVHSTLEVETAATHTLEGATARVEKGVAAITDQLQADTARLQAAYDRVKAENDLRVALGVLATDMNLAPDTPVSLATTDLSSRPDAGFTQSVHDLIEEAVETHPSVVAAEARWQAALAKVREVRAQGLPTLDVVGQLSYSTQPVSASLGQEEQPARTRDNYIGLKFSVPLFEGLGRLNQIREAEADAEAQEENLRDVKRSAANEVWLSLQTLQSDAENLRLTDALVQRAKESLTAVDKRYLSGVGSILELLNSQNTLAQAQQQQIQAQFDWRNARIHLLLSLGRLGKSDIH